MYHRTPPEGSGFDTEWKHSSSLLVSKAVKDMIIKSGRESEWTLTEINNTFFRDQNVWINLNQLTVAM